MKKRKCIKCGSARLDDGSIRVGKVSDSNSIAYRSKAHHPYADHVQAHRATVCLDCGYAEIFFDTDDLKRKKARI
jgi:predicted nucleic-acid-binding Zn-ribbon protein